MLRRTLLVISSLMLAFSTIAFAQQPQTPAPPAADTTAPTDGMGRKDGRRLGRRDHRADMFGLARELNLTEDQRQQKQAIIQRHLEGTTAQREELSKLRQKRIAGTFTVEDEARAKALHQELQDSMKGIRDEVNGILTSEQRSKLEQIETKRKAEEMRKRRTENLEKNSQ